jgi:hypothetical protein
MPEKDSLDPAVPAQQRCPGCDEYGASHTSPSIEHPAVPATCEYCGPACYGGAAHNARVEDGARYTDDPVPAVPAQEAPRETWIDVADRLPTEEFVVIVKGGVAYRSGCEWFTITGETWPGKLIQWPVKWWMPFPVLPSPKRPAEPQAGAQVPSQDVTYFVHTKEGRMEVSSDPYRRDYVSYQDFTVLEGALNSIKSYATEAAKTPITRESILAAPQVDAPIPDDLEQFHRSEQYAVAEWSEERETWVLYGVPITLDGLIQRIAQAEAENRARKLTELAQSDELQGFCRLVLSEIGGGL